MKYDFDASSEGAELLIVTVQRERQFLRYGANTAIFQELLSFLFEECCSRTKAVEARQIIRLQERPAAHAAQRIRK